MKNIIGKTIVFKNKNGDTIKAQVILYYLGCKKITETCIVAVDSENAEHHVFASEVLFFSEKTYNASLLIWKTIDDFEPIKNQKIQYIIPDTDVIKEGVYLYCDICCKEQILDLFGRVINPLGIGSRIYEKPLPFKKWRAIISAD